MIESLPRIAGIAVICGLIGAVYSGLAYHAPITGFTIGAGNGFSLSALEILLMRGTALAILHRLPFLAFLSLRVLAYVVVIAAVDGVAIRLIAHQSSLILTYSDYLFTIAMCVFGNAIVGIDDLLGQGVLLAFIAGRYHHPQREQRALLFIDMCGSTSAAERLGEERFLALLNVFFADITQPISKYGGTIHKYVGDEAIATWPLRAGSKPPRCIEACLAAADRLVERNEAYRGAFGQTVEFRAALHAGAVVVGELGYGKREIALIGDAMNTTSRLLEACRETGNPMLASTDLIARLGGLPDQVSARPPVTVALRGKSAPVTAVALARAR